ncbi:hypothetical protein DPMN_159576 [Dreissena polymorpha]|uniref:Uncharacterized protein n=1 Tax=Dreissena polymorpha TaxID=45954 RepID=A0A9D4EKW3_DREPO|nr:hypothetical protein DPMN_159576 [Dreissena polymorpha]
MVKLAGLSMDHPDRFAQLPFLPKNTLMTCYDDTVCSKQPLTRPVLFSYGGLFCAITDAADNGINSKQLTKEGTCLPNRVRGDYWGYVLTKNRVCRPRNEELLKTRYRSQTSETALQIKQTINLPAMPTAGIVS